MSDKPEIVLTAEDLDTIGEIMNISMGSAATAVSTMLEKQVAITTPSMTQDSFGNIDSSNLEPALIVKIKYVEGIEGINVIMLRRRDIQIILDLLMGNEFSDESDDFEFDDMSMSAACEVMNQMMGSSATALSEILGIPINISTPEATLVETKAEVQEAFYGIDISEKVVAISFKMMIKDIVDTTFTCFLPTMLAERIIGMVSGEMEEEPPAAELPPEAPVPVPPAPTPPPAAPIPAQAPPPPEAPAPVPPVAVSEPPAQAAPVQQPPQASVPAQRAASAPPPAAPAPAAFTPPPAAPAPAASAPQFEPLTATGSRAPMQFETQPVGGTPPQPPVPTYPYGGQPPYMQMPPYGYMPTPYGGYAPQAPPQPGYSVQSAEFPDFSRQMYAPVVPANSMGLLMGVQLDVSVVIGRTKRKIKDIMDFGQGTVLELDKQTGAPAEIVVNGQLLAYGDVIVVGDNFGVRVTEIVGTKELLDSLDSGNK